MYYLSDEQIQRMIDRVEYRIRNPFTPEEALAFLVRAGIWDKEGNYTGPYAELNQFVNKTNNLKDDGVCTTSSQI